MFGNVVYYDKKKIDEYRSVIKGQRNLEVEEYEVSNDKGIQVDLKAFGADAKASKTYKAKVQESLLYNCDEFEKLLSGRDDYFDFTQSSDFDLMTMSRGVIIKFDYLLRAKPARNHHRLPEIVPQRLQHLDAQCPQVLDHLFLLLLSLGSVFQSLALRHIRVD